MSKKFPFWAKLLGLLTLVVFSASVCLTAQEIDVMEANKEGTIALPTPTSTGGEVLPAGKYKVYCEHLTTRHHFVFERMQEEHLHGSSGAQRTKSEITKVPCRMEKLSSKAEYTELRTRTDSTGRCYVQQVTIKGEDVRHILE